MNTEKIISLNVCSVLFVIERTKLTTQSEYFKTLLEGSLPLISNGKESYQLQEQDLETFRHFFCYLVTGELHGDKTKVKAMAQFYMVRVDIKRPVTKIFKLTNVISQPRLNFLKYVITVCEEVKDYKKVKEVFSNPRYFNHFDFYRFLIRFIIEGGSNLIFMKLGFDLLFVTNNNITDIGNFKLLPQKMYSECEVFDFF